MNKKEPSRLSSKIHENHGTTGDKIDGFHDERRYNFHIQIEQAGSTAWLVSFTDIIALMLTFFVLLYAMSDPVQQKWVNKMNTAQQNTVQYGANSGVYGNQEGVNINRLSFRKAENMDYAEAVLQEILNENEKKPMINIIRTRDELRLSFNDASLLTGDNAPSPEVTQLLERIGSALNNLNNSLVIAGHAETDKMKPIFTQTQNFAKILRQAGYKKPLALSMQVTKSGQWIDMVVRPHDGYRIIR